MFNCEKFWQGGSTDINIRVLTLGPRFHKDVPSNDSTNHRPNGLTGVVPQVLLDVPREDLLVIGHDLVEGDEAGTDADTVGTDGSW